MQEISKRILEAIRQINDLEPDVVVATGDLTDNGYHLEFLQVASYLSKKVHWWSSPATITLDMWAMKHLKKF